ncbi:hypothetical protein WJT74_01200 [Sphingomicrobium sp. XHP0239]|uniref:hypothetical protein n=1 Tax=Sphingomicrobium maritimum TaxID=3133972 RepID=UPI0031CC3984
MVARKAKPPRKAVATKKVVKKVQRPKIAAADVERPLKGFFHADELDDTFGFARFYWEPGRGPRASIVPQILKKRRPAAAEASSDTAARVEILLPTDAPEEYADVDRLVRRYEEWLPEGEPTGFAQVTIRFPNAPNLHGPYEECRAWLRDHYVVGMRVPIILILHAPYLVGSDAPGHVHALILAGRLSRFGWMTVDRIVASDEGRNVAISSWSKRSKPPSV